MTIYTSGVWRTRSITGWMWPSVENITVTIPRTVTVAHVAGGTRGTTLRIPDSLAYSFVANFSVPASRLTWLVFTFSIYASLIISTSRPAGLKMTVAMVTSLTFFTDWITKGGPHSLTSSAITHVSLVTTTRTRRWWRRWPPREGRMGLCPP